MRNITSLCYTVVLHLCHTLVLQIVLHKCVTHLVLQSAYLKLHGCVTHPLCYANVTRLCYTRCDTLVLRNIHACVTRLCNTLINAM